MINDNQTNYVYLADTLSRKYPAFAKDLISKLEQEKIPFGILPNTKDVWAADYMPVQVSDHKFVRFTYTPDYLMENEEYKKTISDVDAICKAIGIRPVESDIVLDGGNLSKWNNKVLMTTKVFTENSNIPELELIEQLKNLLEINDLFFVPVEKEDWLGHVDGMARFIDSDRVLINDFSKEEQKFYIDFLAALYNANLKWTTFPYNPYDNKNIDTDAAGLYLNYLELATHIILPIFGKETDEKAIEKAKEIFPDKQVLTVMSNKPAKQNGIINCLTWNIKK